MKKTLPFILFIAAVSAPAQDPVPSPVPSIAQEAELERESRRMFESGVEAFGARKFTLAVQQFEKLLATYPTSNYRLETLYYLGQSHFHGGKFADAVKPLQLTIETAGRSPVANEARVILGNTYLELEKHTEAYLVSEELLKQPDLRTTLRGKALLLRAQAQNGMKQPLESEKTFTIFQAIADQDPELERELAQSYLFSLLVKSGECEKLAGSPLPEEALLEQMNRRSVCLLEMGALLSRSARILSSDEIREGSELVLKSYRQYSAACENPPLQKGARTDQQLKTARQELSQKLRESCRSTFDLLMEGFKERESAAALTSSLQKTPPASASSAPAPSASPLFSPSPAPSASPAAAPAKDLSS